MDAAGSVYREGAASLANVLAASLGSDCDLYSCSGTAVFGHFSPRAVCFTIACVIRNSGAGFVPIFTVVLIST